MLVKRKCCWLVCIIIITVTTLSLVNGWKLRDLSQKNDENKAVPKKPVFRDIPMRKVINIERLKVKSDERSGEADDDDDDDDDKKNDFSFERVRTTHFDLPLKPVITLSNPDVEQEEEERKEGAIETQEVASWFSYLPSFNIFGEKDEDENSESSGIFGWLLGWFGNDDDEPSRDKDADDETSWFSYLKSLTELLSFDEAPSTDDTNKRRRDKPQVVVPEKREPLTAQSFENLLLSLPSFIPNYNKISDIDCKRMGQIFQRQVRGQKLWALQSINRCPLHCNPIHV